MVKNYYSQRQKTFVFLPLLLFQEFLDNNIYNYYSYLY